MTDNQHPDPQPHQQRWQPGPLQQGPPQQPHPSEGQPQYGQPQPQFQQPYQQQPQFQQPYAVPVAAGPSSQSKVFGWVMALFAVLAIACCFGPWASVKASSTELPISMTMSVNGFNHDSCSGSTLVCDSAKDDSSSSSPTSTPSDDEGGSIWEGWVIAVIGAAAIVLGVLRGLGKSALSVPAAVAGAAGGLVVVGLTVYRWSWIHDRAGEAKDAMGAAESSNVDVSFGAGWGLWLTLTAGVLLLLVGVGGLVKRQ